MESNADTRGELATIFGQAVPGETLSLIFTDGKQVKHLKVSVLEVESAPQQRRQLGFFPKVIKSDLLEPTDPELIALFYGEK